MSMQSSNKMNEIYMNLLRALMELHQIEENEHVAIAKAELEESILILQNLVKE